jgi:hypothetical protein
MLTAAIEWGKLVQVIWVSMIAGVAVTAVFSGVIVAGAKASEARRNDQAGQAALYGALTAFTLCCFLAGLVFGVSVILTKD